MTQRKTSKPYTFNCLTCGVEKTIVLRPTTPRPKYCCIAHWYTSPTYEAYAQKCVDIYLMWIKSEDSVNGLSRTLGMSGSRVTYAINRGRKLYNERMRANKKTIE